ncbi:MAG TPA: response regulator [Methylomirabilota bacterium]|nr:response regulator [Methylomirabilota bacterium]
MREVADRSPRAAMHVLVVDDDDEMRALLRRMLESDGFLVTERDRGTHVLEAVREARVDLIILDKEMPGLGGLELLPLLRREFPEVPVVFVTAFGGRQVAASALRFGATSYLEKPFRLGQLRDIIDGLIPPPSADDSGSH